MASRFSSKPFSGKRPYNSANSPAPKSPVPRNDFNVRVNHTLSTEGDGVHILFALQPNATEPLALQHSQRLCFLQHASALTHATALTLQSLNIEAVNTGKWSSSDSEIRHITLGLFARRPSSLSMQHFVDVVSAITDPLFRSAPGVQPFSVLAADASVRVAPYPEIEDTRLVQALRIQDTPIATVGLEFPGLARALSATLEGPNAYITIPSARLAANISANQFLALIRQPTVPTSTSSYPPGFAPLTAPAPAPAPAPVNPTPVAAPPVTGRRSVSPLQARIEYLLHAGIIREVVNTASASTSAPAPAVSAAAATSDPDVNIMDDESDTETQANPQDGA